MKTKKITVAEYINTVLLTDINYIREEKPYLAYFLISAGIEFLGKCLNKSKNWQKNGESQKDFETAICKLSALEKYRKYTSELKKRTDKYGKKQFINPTISLYKSLRCGLLHAMLPGDNIILSDGENEPNESNGLLTLYLDTFYNDFSAACTEILSTSKIKKSKNSKFFTVGYVDDNGKQFVLTGTTINDEVTIMP